MTPLRMTKQEVAMLIKERLAIPIKSDQNTMIHWWVILGALFLVSLALRDFARQTFGLDFWQAFMELALAVFVICLPAVALMSMAAIAWHALKWDTGQGILLSGIALLPLIIFMLYAHLDMSHALAPLKIEFNQRVAATANREGDPLLLADLTKARDRYLAEYGYVRLSSWRTGGNESDCTAVYLFVGAF